MQQSEFKIIITQYKDLNELPENDRLLILAAREIARSAYAPYSGFRVGAALRMSDGCIITGNNQENASSPVGCCAERTALYWANANFPEKPVLALAITAIDRAGNLAAHLSPCGTCRQALLETEIRFNQPIRVLLDSRNQIDALNNVKSLLPLSFNEDSVSVAVQ
ncbi:MAG: cytidine deaminase [Prolixibacteraceae bacterium]